MHSTCQNNLPAQSLEQPSDACGDQQLTTPRILCIDDDPEISLSIESRLSEYRVTVDRAYFGTQGFWEAITGRPDLIIMDLAMPNGDGNFVLESLRTNRDTESLPVIVLTGMRDPRVRSRLFALGANQYLTKPLRFEELLPEITRFIHLKKLTAATPPVPENTIAENATCE